VGFDPVDSEIYVVIDKYIEVDGEPRVIELSRPFDGDFIPESRTGVERFSVFCLYSVPEIPDILPRARRPWADGRPPGTPLSESCFSGVPQSEDEAASCFVMVLADAEKNLFFF